MKKRIVLPIALVVILIAAVIWSKSGSTDEREIFTTVQQGKFTVEISTTGELIAARSTQIRGPERARNFRLNNLKIERLVEEGTVVQQGDFVAMLDRSELYGRIADSEIEVETETAQFEQTQLDTALTLRTERDQIINLEYGVEERKLILEQSQFEPPATIRQNEIALDKALRDLEQAKESYQIKVQQSQARMRERASRLREEQRELEELNSLMDEFTIYAPQDGMVIYEKGFDGSRVMEGSTITSWNPVVATLPDLTTMNSITYVNEVDIRRVKNGQEVKLGLDAFPDKRLTGKVVRVSNVGQQNPNSDAKVFEVTILINESDPSLRPAMTTSNTIIAEEIEDALFIPLEGLFVESDSINYVYRSNGQKQEVELGLSNNNETVILQGLAAGDRIYLSEPPAHRDNEISLLPSMNGKRQRQLEQVEQESEVSESGSEKVTLPDGREVEMTPEIKKRMEEMRKSAGAAASGR